MKSFGKIFSETREKISNTVNSKINTIGQGLGQKIGKECCGICNQPISVFDKAKVADGACCKNCRAKLSVFSRKGSEITLKQIKEQITAREKNARKLAVFQPSKTIGLRTKLFIDEANGQFLISASTDFQKENADVFNCEDITNCSIDVKEYKTEVLYENEKGKKLSFMPPMFAYSYDIFLEISINIPYIDVLRIPVNNKPIDNDQKILFKYDRKQNPSMGGKTSNSEEVRASTQYQKILQIAQDMQQALKTERDRATGFGTIQRKALCPWCGVKSSSSNGVCDHCGGPLDT